MLEPSLRFKEFADDYITVELSTIVDRVKRKNKNNETDRPLTIASLEGLVDQRTYFDKPIASKDMSGYYLIKNGEFAYNKSYSKGYPVGSIKRLEKYESGALSTLYICFALKNNSGINSDYLKQYFESPLWHEKVKNICAEGARNHGLLNVIPDEFYAVEHNLAPTTLEQGKIASFLGKIDLRIEKQKEIVDSVTKIKNSIISQIFDGTLRIDSVQTGFSDWEWTYLSDILKERKEKSHGSEEVYSVSVSKGLVNQIEHLGRSFAAEDTTKYKVAYPGDVIYTKSPTGDFKWGIVKQSNIEKNVIISPLYGVFIPKNRNIGYLIDAYFSSSVRAHNYLITQVRKGAKNTINVTNAEFLDKQIYLPTDESECSLLVKYIKLLNEQVTKEEEYLNSLIKFKAGLLQRMFC